MSRHKDSMCLVKRYGETKLYHWAGRRESFSNGEQITVSSCGRLSHENHYASEAHWIPTRYVHGNLTLCRVCERIGPWPSSPSPERSDG